MGAAKPKKVQTALDGFRPVRIVCVWPTQPTNGPHGDITMSQTVSLPNRFEYLHMLTPFIMDTIIHEPVDPSHPWHNPKLKKNDPYAVVPRRPAAQMNPEWDAVLGQRGDQVNQDTVYGAIAAAYASDMARWSLFDGQSNNIDFTETRTLLACWCVFWGLLLNRRHQWDWSILPERFRELLPEDPYGPEVK